MKEKDRIENRIIELHPHLAWKRGLGGRAWNVLDNMDINSREQLMEILGNGTWETYNKSILRKARNFGRKTWMELCVWAGLPKPRMLDPRKMIKFPCPHCQGRGWVRHWKPNKVIKSKTWDEAMAGKPWIKD